MATSQPRSRKAACSAAAGTPPAALATIATRPDSWQRSPRRSGRGAASGRVALTVRVTSSNQAVPVAP